MSLCERRERIHMKKNRRLVSRLALCMAIMLVICSFPVAYSAEPGTTQDTVDLEVTEPITETGAENDPESALEFEAEPVADTETEPEAEPVEEPETIDEPEAEPATGGETEPEQAEEPEAEPVTVEGTEPGLETDGEPEAEPVEEPETVEEPEAEPVPVEEPQPEQAEEPETEPVTTEETESEPETAEEPEAEPVPAAEQETQPEGETEPEIVTDASVPEEYGFEYYDDEEDDEIFFEEESEDGLVEFEDDDFGVVASERLLPYDEMAEEHVASVFHEEGFSGQAGIEMVQPTVSFGDTVTLKARIEGTEQVYLIIWEANDADDRGWFEIGRGDQYEFTLTQENMNRDYRLVLMDLE